MHCHCAGDLCNEELLLDPQREEDHRALKKYCG